MSTLLYGLGTLVAFLAGLFGGAVLLRLMQLRADRTATWDRQADAALDIFDDRDADAEQWGEAERRLAPDHGYGPAPQGPGMAIYPRRTT